MVLRTSDGKEMGVLGTKDEANTQSVVRLHTLGFAHADDADLLIVNYSSDGARVWNIGTGKEARRLDVTRLARDPQPRRQTPRSRTPSGKSCFWTPPPAAR